MSARARKPAVTPEAELMKMGDPLERVALRYRELTGERLTGRGDQKQGRCPAHKDRHASFSLGRSEEDGRALIYCHAGCAFAEVLASLELPPAVLFPRIRRGSRKAERLDREQGQLRRHVTLMTSLRPDDLAEHEGWSVDALDALQLGGWREDRLSVSERDAEGHAIGILTYVPKHMREGTGAVQGAKANVQPSGEGRGLVYAAEGISQGSEVVVVEGVACALAVETLGYAAVGIPNANRPFPVRWSSLVGGCDVVVIGDNDVQGQHAAEQSAKNIVRAASSVRVAQLDDRWHDLADVLREEGIAVASDGLEEAIEAAELVEKPKVGRPTSSLEAAMGYLSGALADGNWQLSSMVIDSRPKGVGERTLEKARDQLGVLAEKQGKTWMLSLPKEGEIER